MQIDQLVKAHFLFKIIHLWSGLSEYCRYLLRLFYTVNSEVCLPYPPLQIKNTTVSNRNYRLVFLASKESRENCYIVTAFDKYRAQPAPLPRPENIQVCAVLWIRIRIGSVFRSFVDPDSYEDYESGSGSTHVNSGIG